MSRARVGEVSFTSRSMSTVSSGTVTPTLLAKASGARPEVEAGQNRLKHLGRGDDFAEGLHLALNERASLIEVSARLSRRHWPIRTAEHSPHR